VSYALFKPKAVRTGLLARAVAALCGVLAAPVFAVETADRIWSGGAILRSHGIMHTFLCH
jgi:hypothetical protein